ncbi:packaged DNA stabilization gp4 family protein [Stenotrophomonas sp. 59]|uniref:packaged DNA stabilization gp4 family protein n=1 Tax=Stenotrophomonas sp. 59 TaxID=3051120 RepID=UPI00256EE4B4|nr:packaged DNA stabilization gp4 family protein [Stenotrophomonas sp. 59]
MSKVSEVIRDSLLLLRVVDADEAPEAKDAEDAIRALNLMMTTLEAEGLSLGWSAVSKPDDVMPVLPEAEEAITYLLATRLRAKYGVAMDPDVFQMAQDLLGNLRAQVASADYSRISYPDLPVGQGQPWGAWYEGYYR